MVTALIDNATVSSIQRALGKAKLRDVGVLDVEHAALGRFAEAILLCQRVVVPDNYKQEYTAARKRLLAELNVEFISVPEVLDDSLNQVAKSLAEPWKEAYIEGQERSLFQQYFKQINAFSRFIWQYSSSEFFLVFRAHGVEKESPLIEAILSSPKDDDLGKELQIIAKNGKPVAWNDMSRHVQRMLGVMGWIGHQYIWHQAFAAQHDLTYMPHPLRDFFANDFLTRVNLGATNASTFDNVFSTEISKFQGTLQAGIAQLSSLHSSITMSMPPMLPLLAKESTSGNDAIRVLGQLRNESKVVELRQILAEAQKQRDIGNYNPLSKLASEIEKIGKSFLLEKGIEQRLISISPPTSLVGIKVEGDDSAIRRRMPAWLYKQYFFTRRYRAFIRDVMAELAAPGQYGRLKTKMNSWAWVADENDEYDGDPFYTKEYRFPSQFHKPLDSHKE